MVEYADALQQLVCGAQHQRHGARCKRPSCSSPLQALAKSWAVPVLHHFVVWHESHHLDPSLDGAQVITIQTCALATSSYGQLPPTIGIRPVGQICSTSISLGMP